ncbi:cyclin N-terminal domain-containing protein 1-like [Panulirus ornatus]|uniref:cyclin N-terminal domain-containing protein 1-like n=1 Tax=Panulirus ornatus TaxID=150431 RepID=UPI003A8B1679
MEDGRVLTFSTPPSYSFQSSDKLFTAEELKKHVQETLQVLLAENLREKRLVHPCLTVLHMESSMKFIWHVTDMFRLTTQVRYIAFDLFQRFMLGHMESLLAHVLSTTTEGRQRSRLMKMVTKRVKYQAPLRVLTCVMIASKLDCHKRCLTSLMVQKCLKQMDVNFHTSLINRSERRVLEQLDSRCHRNSSLLVYIGVVISVVGLWEGDGANFTDKIKKGSIQPVSPEDLFEMSVSLLDMVYLNHEKVYQELYTSLTGLPSIPNKHKAAFAHVIADRMLLAGSVVASAALVLGGQEVCAAVVSSITTHIHTPCKDIITLASCIMTCAGLPSNIKSLLANN